MIYLDNNATTQVAPEVFEAMRPFLTTHYGNASSGHALGRESRAAIEQARRQIATLLDAGETGEILFTSCGSESNNWAIGGFLEQNPNRRHIITTRIEHESVRKLCQHLSDRDCEVSWLEVDEDGSLDLDDLRKALRPDTGIVSIMAANNETGVLSPITEISNIIREHSEAIFHVDAVQSTAKISVSLRHAPVDLFAVSGHKFHAPKGVGALYIRKGVELPPFIIGGGQERGRRSGTEAVPNIVALGRAAQLATEAPIAEHMRRLRDRLEDGILSSISGTFVNGTTEPDRRLPNTSNISFAGVVGPDIVSALDDAGIAVSSGSACHSDSESASPVLTAMGIEPSIAVGSVRFSVGRYNTDADVARTLDVLPEIVEMLRGRRRATATYSA